MHTARAMCAPRLQSQSTDHTGVIHAGYSKGGYHYEGYHKDGYGKDGYDKYGYDKYGYDSKSEWMPSPSLICQLVLSDNSGTHFNSCLKPNSPNSNFSPKPFLSTSSVVGSTLWALPLKQCWSPGVRAHAQPS